MKQSGKNSEVFKAKVFRALSDPARLQIIHLLKDGGKCVNEMVGEIKIVQPAVSRHLKILKECGIVEESKLGNKRLYKVTDSKIFKVIDSLSNDLMTNLRGHVLKRMI